MKLSFSTRGWPGMSWDGMLDTALEMGFSGIEVYNLPKFDPMLDKGGPFHKYQAAATVRQLRDKKLQIPCFDTSCDLADKDESVDSLLNLIEVAHNTRVPYVVACALEDNEELVAQRLAKLLEHAEALGVGVLLKTSGIYADTARLRSMMDRFASDYLGALWDVHHPYRDLGRVQTLPSKIWEVTFAMSIFVTLMNRATIN